MDRYGDHALVCPCKGDRTVRHNAVRNVAYNEAVESGMRPEREKAGLLPGRPHEDGLPVESSLRRPADIWIPRGQHSKGEAWDFACTSAMRADYLQSIPDDPLQVFEKYEDFKRNFKDTEAECERQGFRFNPLIVDSHSGAWSPFARIGWDWLAKSQSSAWNEAGEITSIRIAQRLSFALHRENARAILRRAPPIDEPDVWTGWEDAMIDES